MSNAQHKAWANFSQESDWFFIFPITFFVHSLKLKFQFYELNLLMSTLIFNQKTFIFVTTLNIIENSFIHLTNLWPKNLSIDLYWHKIWGILRTIIVIIIHYFFKWAKGKIHTGHTKSTRDVHASLHVFRWNDFVFILIF